MYTHTVSLWVFICLPVNEDRNSVQWKISFKFVFQIYCNLPKCPLPWASVHWLVQCTLECHRLTQCILEYHWATQRILAGYTGTPLEKPSWNSPTMECHWRNLVESAPHWEATGETLTFAAYTGTPLEGQWQPTHAPTYIVKHAEWHRCQFEWQDGGTPVSKWTGLCIFSLYLEFTALQWIPVLLLTHVSTSTLLSACLWYDHNYNFCVFGVASHMKSV